MILLSGCAVAAAMALVGCAGVSSAPSVAPSPNREQQATLCQPRDLRAVHLPGEGAGSQDYSEIALRNIASTSCTLDGWATVRLISRSHRPIGPVAGHHVSSRPKLVVLAPGQRAGITVSVGSVQVPTAAQCQQEATRTIAVTLPGGGALLVPAVIQVCSRDAGLTMGPIERGISLDPI